jgi:hypothetical protein
MGDGGDQVNQVYCFGKDYYEVECDIGGDEKLIAKGKTRDEALRNAVDMLTAYIQSVPADVVIEVEAQS